MSETLGLHIGEAGIVAVIANAEADPTAATIVPLGTSSPAAARAVAAGPDGTVLVGDAAASADGPIVFDPIDRARLGRTGALTAVIAHVLRRAATADSVATRLAIVVPDDFDSDARDQVVVAANGAGITDVVTVPETAAMARASSVPADAIVAVAIGAALIGSTDLAPPIVTREDLGETVTPGVGRAIPAPTDLPSGPVSVFDESDPEPAPVVPVRQSPAPVAAQHAPGPTARSERPAPVTSPPIHEIPDRSTPIGLLVGVIVLLVAIVVIWLLLFTVGGGNQDTTTVVPETTSTTTELAATTTVASTPVTSSSTTTSSIAMSSTTSSSTTSSSSTSSTTTTTTPLRVASPGVVTLSANGLLFDDGTIVQFGQSIEVVLAEAIESLGSPDEDTGFEIWESCIGTRTRSIRWGSLELIFTEEVADSDTGVFTQWYTEGHNDPAGLVTLDGLGESATVGFLEVTFGDALVLLAAFEGGDIGLFAITNPSTGAVLNGITDGLHPEGVVTTLWAGDSCTRVFT
jgi:hypothetical protein